MYLSCYYLLLCICFEHQSVSCIEATNVGGRFKKSNRSRKILVMALFANFKPISLVVAGALSFGTFFGGTAIAQDLLPADNGIYTYHESPRWRESEEHPLRLLAYSTHWMGWVMRESLFRPLSYFMSSSEFTRSFFCLLYTSPSPRD